MYSMSTMQIPNQEALSTAVLAAVMDPTMVIDEDGIIVYFNPAACHAFQVHITDITDCQSLSQPSILGQKVTVLFSDPDTLRMDDEKCLERYKTTTTGGGENKNNNRIGIRNRSVVTAKRADGSTWKASLSISEVKLEQQQQQPPPPQSDNNNNNQDASASASSSSLVVKKPKTKYFVGTLRDVTESINREQLFSSVIDEAIDAIFTINEHGLITLVNRSACIMFGYTHEELMYRNISILMPEPHRTKHDSYIRNHMETGIQKMIGTDRTVTAQRKDKSLFQCRLGLSKISYSNMLDDTTVTFVGLLHDLTHELAARDADARATLADQMRRQKALFLASMSHEIRTPLNGIFGMLELLRSTQLDEIQSEWLATCSRSAQSLTTILDDILLFSRADGGGITLETLSFNIRDSIEDAVTVLASKTNDKYVDLVYTVSRNVPDRLIGDPTRLRQVILIFLSNALKFTQVGHVALEVSLDGEEEDSDDEDCSEHDDGRRQILSTDNDVNNTNIVKLKFEVSDTGIGMSKKQVRKLFQPFTQADASTTRQYGGTGLGLSIAQKLVELMEGDIKVESRVNRGSTFTFTAQLTKDPDASTRTSVSDLLDKIPDEDLELLKGTHILSIDDNAVNTDYLVNLLKLLGCDVTGERSGVDGIERCKLAALREDPYEILLLDFAMPSMSGLEVAEFIASSRSIASTNMRVIMLGSIDAHRSIAACPHVHGFTTKPIRRVPLIKMIVEQLKIKRGMLGAPTPNRPPMSLMSNPPSDPLPPSSISSSDTTTCANISIDDKPNATAQKLRINGSMNNAPPQDLRPKRPNPLSILSVEDNLINQKVLVSILSRWKCQVTTALNGLSGFEERISHRGKKSFDLILCDLHMPLCDGFQCVKMIREWEVKNNIKPIVVCAITADANAETRERCLSEEAGFNEFLAKPLRKNVLRETIVKLCGQERLGEETLTTKAQPASDEKFPLQEEKKELEPRVASRPIHVLVIDDAPTMRLLLRTFLTKMGCTVSEASSGESAVEIVRMSTADKEESANFEMIFCDMRMPPGIDGMETARRIKEITGASAIPIIGMTADEVPHAAFEEARTAGMVSLISKPIGRTQLANFLAEYAGAVSVPSEVAETVDVLDAFDKNRALDNCSYDQGLLKKLLSDIAKDLQTNKEALEITVQRKDCARTAEVTHNIKGMASICGFNRLAKAACECQESASLSEYSKVRSQSQIVLEEISNACKIAKTFKIEKKCPSA